MFRQIGPTEIILIIAVVVLLFGAKKLPDLARGSGRALRIFKSETKGLIDDDDDGSKDKNKDSDDESTPELETTDSGRPTYDIDESTGNVVPRDQSK